MTKTLTPAQIEARRAGGRARAAQPSFKEAQSKGGKTRAAQESMIEARRKGFATTLAKYPSFARGLLAGKIRAFNHQKATDLGISYRAQMKRVRAAAAQAEIATLAALQREFRRALNVGAPLPAGSLWAM